MTISRGRFHSLLRACPPGKMLLMRLKDGRVGRADAINVSAGRSVIYMTFPDTGQETVDAERVAGYTYGTEAQWRSVARSRVASSPNRQSF